MIVENARPGQDHEDSRPRSSRSHSHQPHHSHSHRTTSTTTTTTTTTTTRMLYGLWALLASSSFSHALWQSPPPILPTLARSRGRATTIATSVATATPPSRHVAQHSVSGVSGSHRCCSLSLAALRMRWDEGGDENHDNPVPEMFDEAQASSSSVLSSSSVSVSSSTSQLTKIPRSIEPRVFPQRWVQLAYLSLLALLSDWICFSVAATPDVFEQAFAGHSAASLIDMFLFTNVASCFVVTDVVAKIGLQRAVQAAALLMALGCWCRSGLSFLPMLPGAAHLMTWPVVVLGTILVGAAQPFFQCTPPLLSAQWFRADERATSTAVALNFNQIGIATAFLVGGSMVTDRQGLERYFGLIAVLATLTAVGTLLQFQNEPPVPPSASELEKKLAGRQQEPPFLQSVQAFFRKRGFSQALAAFVCSISITNIVGAFLEEVLERGGITTQFQIDLAGAGFELAILVGGILIGGYVDQTKEYKKVTLWCLIATCLLVIPLGLTEHAIGKEPLLLLLSLLGLGMAAGPIQPINAELAVDVTYPGDETAVESVQQIGGNLISALLVPLAELASTRDYQLLPNIQWAASDIRGDVVLLLTIAMLTIGYFSGFDAPLSRSEADESDEDDASQQGLPLNAQHAVPDTADATTTTTTTTTRMSSETTS